MATPWNNVYHLRTVAETSSKACYDFFYTCVSHLSDKSFASPIIDQEAEAAKKKKEQMDREIEKIKQEYEEKQRRKKATKSNDKDKKRDTNGDDGKAEKERDDKGGIKAIQAGANSSDQTGAIPRVYALHRTFYQMRLERARSLEQAKRAQQRMRDPNLFPAAPKGDIV
ncbi:hypothetical protein ABEF95_002339 [Exophiala dermatitidis]